VNRYPIYIVSKGRWESRLTSKALETLQVPYHIVVEPQELAAYASVIDPRKILILPFSNLGQGSIPARNWIWDHALSKKHLRHWILDDNIRNFYYLRNNKKIRARDGGEIFAQAERFTDRFANVGLSGMNYQWLAKHRQKLLPFILNTRIYSCILVNNGLSHRWRGRYNEDTDLSLRVLKGGLCTIQFNAFLTNKITTMEMKGGNTDELYKDGGGLEMAKSLQRQHPDVTRITWKWGRWQHSVNYRPFASNRLVLKCDDLMFRGRSEAA
jgi:hypothetical protein